MAINTQNLRNASRRAMSSQNIAKSLKEAKINGQTTAFLSHSHKDRELAKGLQAYLSEHGWDLYIDWEDSSLPDSPDEKTANSIKEQINERDLFIFLATQNSQSSRWCPWEIGIAEVFKKKSSIIIVPTEGDNGWVGNEYLNLYRRIDHPKEIISDNKTLQLMEPHLSYIGASLKEASLQFNK